MAHATTGGVKREVLLERQEKIWGMRQRGMTHERIAQELGLERSTVTKTLRRLSVQIVQKLEDEIVEQKATQLLRLEHIVDEAMRAWEKSREPDRIISKTTAPSRFRGAKPLETTTIQTRNREGDVRYLIEARQALLDIRRLLEMETSKKVGAARSLGQLGEALGSFSDEDIEFVYANLSIGVHAASTTNQGDDGGVASNNYSD